MPYDRNDELPKAVRDRYTAKQQRAFRRAYNSCHADGGESARCFPIAHAAARRAGSGDESSDLARTFSADQRERLAKEGKALPDGSFPIVNKQDLRNAIQAYGRASNKSRAKAHIMKRARALGATDLLPEAWTNDSAGGGPMDVAEKEKKKGYRKKKRESGSLEYECLHDECARIFLTEQAAEDHALAVHSHNEVREAISKALREKFSGPPRQWTFVIDTADDWFVYALEVPGAMDDKLYRQGYSLANGVATLEGEPVEVVRRVVYEPVGGEDS